MREKFELKPCPFCGGEARIETVIDSEGLCYFAVCDCGASMDCRRIEGEAITMWNQRVGDKEDNNGNA